MIAWEKTRWLVDNDTFCSGENDVTKGTQERNEGRGYASDSTIMTAEQKAGDANKGCMKEDTRT